MTLTQSFGGQSLRQLIINSSLVGVSKLAGGNVLCYMLLEAAVKASILLMRVKEVEYFDRFCFCLDTADAVPALMKFLNAAHQLVLSEWLLYNRSATLDFQVAVPLVPSNAVKATLSLVGRHPQSLGSKGIFVSAIAESLWTALLRLGEVPRHIRQLRPSTLFVHNWVGRARSCLPAVFHDPHGEYPPVGFSTLTVQYRSWHTSVVLRDVCPKNCLVLDKVMQPMLDLKIYRILGVSQESRGLDVVVVCRDSTDELGNECACTKIRD
ncbi:hypothetical protein Tco_1152677 [Tanacetum coccineum]